MPKASARWATSAPTRPSPTTPRVLPYSSTPSHGERSQAPAFRAAWAWGTLRAWASSSAMVCSAAERMFDWGALTTMTPRRVAAATSTLSRPMPARPTTTRSAPASSTSAVTLVAERTMRAAAPGIGADQLARGTARARRRPRARRRGARPVRARPVCSVTRMRAMGPSSRTPPGAATAAGCRGGGPGAARAAPAGRAGTTAGRAPGAGRLATVGACRASRSSWSGRGCPG